MYIYNSILGMFTQALQNIEQTEPEVGKLLRAMISTKPGDRPSANELLAQFKNMGESKKPMRYDTS